MKILIYGNGVMANILKECIKSPDELVQIIEPLEDTKIEKDFDVIIDFSHHTATKKLLSLALEYKKPVLIATTGHTKEELDLIEEANKKIKILKMSNTSMGIKVMNKLVQVASVELKDFDIEIIEYHHNRKIDAPSGTAISIAEKIIEVRPELKINTNRKEKREKNEIGIHSVRAGNISGEHIVCFAGEDEIIEIKHTANSRKIFALGAIKEARNLI